MAEVTAPTHAKPKPGKPQQPPAAPPVYGIFDHVHERWYMVGGLVFNTLYRVVADAQLMTMLALTYGEMTSARFEVLPLDAAPAPVDAPPMEHHG